MKTLIFGKTGTGKTFLAKKLLSNLKQPLIIFDLSSYLIDEYVSVSSLDSLKYAINNKLNIVIDIENDLKHFNLNELKEIVFIAALEKGYGLVFDEGTNEYIKSFKPQLYSFSPSISYMLIAQDEYQIDKSLITSDLIFNLNTFDKQTKDMRTGSFSFTK